MLIKDKNIIVTGGASGFGREISKKLSSLGANLIVLDIKKSSIDDENIEKIHYIECDITKEEQVDNAFQKIISGFGNIDILINNAGILHSEPFINILSKERKHSFTNWKNVIDLNLSAAFLVASYTSELMVSKRTKGLIINISSISADGNAGQSAYSASKAGLESITKVWAKELGCFGIRSVCISPGFFETQSTRTAINDDIINHIIKETPLSRLGSVEDLLKTVIFTIENDFLTGETVRINGGLTL